MPQVASPSGSMQPHILGGLQALDQRLDVFKLAHLSAERETVSERDGHVQM